MINKPIIPSDRSKDVVSQSSTQFLLCKMVSSTSVIQCGSMWFSMGASFDRTGESLKTLESVMCSYDTHKTQPPHVIQCRTHHVHAA